MDVNTISLKETGYFSKLICDYVAAKEPLQSFYDNYPDLKGFKKQIAAKEASFPLENRAILADALEKQYARLDISEMTRLNVQRLREYRTFTIVTGHQLNLFTGPLYFLYKIVSTIKLSKRLALEFPEYTFVPIYWMATEDHDFEEINFFNFQGKKIQWNHSDGGAVGRLSTTGLEEVLETFSKLLGDSSSANWLKDLFTNAYLKNDNLTDATRYLVNALFREYGLVIVDGDDRALKSLLMPYAKKDIFNQLAFTQVSETIEAIKAVDENYTIQVNPREINYFYLGNGFRQRIVERKGSYSVNETSLSFTEETLMQEMDQYPERFSPNVIARPLYQEVILPNLGYIGGAGEIAYWLELKKTFRAMDVPFPILLVRNSCLIMTDKQQGKLQRLGIAQRDLFLSQSTLINKKIREISNIAIDFTPQKQCLEEQFSLLFELAELTDKSFLGAVKAQEAKQKKGLAYLEKRMLKAQKRKLADHVARMMALQNELFPNQSLQERTANFSEFYLHYNKELIPMLMDAFDPLQMMFNIITVNE